MTNPWRTLSVPGYLVAGLLVLIPLADTVLGVWPLRPGSVNWRFGATGVGSRALLLMLLGGLLAHAVAIAAGHRRTLRALAAVTMAGVLLLLAAAVLFTLDSLQMRAEVLPDMVSPYDISWGAALTRILLTAITAALLARAGWILSRRRAGSQKRREETGVLIGSD